MPDRLFFNWGECLVDPNAQPLEEFDHPCLGCGSDDHSWCGVLVDWKETDAIAEKALDNAKLLPDTDHARVISRS